MSIIVSTTYPDPRESERCRRSPLPRRSLEPWDVVDDRCDPSVLLETRLDPLRKAPAKADSLRSGFGLISLRALSGTNDPTTFDAILSCDASARRSFCAKATWAPSTTSLNPKASGAAAKRSPLVSILRSSRSDGRRSGFRSEPLESLTLRSFASGSFSRRSIAYCATLSPFPVESAFQWKSLEVVTPHVGRRVDLARFRDAK